VEKNFIKNLLQLEMEKENFVLENANIKINDLELKFGVNHIKIDIYFDNPVLTNLGDEKQNNLKVINVKNAVLKTVLFVNVVETKFIYM